MSAAAVVAPVDVEVAAETLAPETAQPTVAMPAVTSQVTVPAVTSQVAMPVVTSRIVMPSAVTYSSSPVLMAAPITTQAVPQYHYPAGSVDVPVYGSSVTVPRVYQQQPSAAMPTVAYQQAQPMSAEQLRAIFPMGAPATFEPFTASHSYNIVDSPSQLAAPTAVGAAEPAAAAPVEAAAQPAKAEAKGQKKSSSKKLKSKKKEKGCC